MLTPSSANSVRHEQEQLKEARANSVSAKLIHSETESKHQEFGS